MSKQTKLEQLQTESNTLKQQILEEIQNANKLLKTLNDKPDKILTQLINNAEIQNTVAQQPTPQTDQWSNLPWRPYKNGRGYWIFAKNQDGTPNQKAKSLIDALNRNGGKISTSTAEYRFSGENNKFISKTLR